MLSSNSVLGKAARLPLRLLPKTAVLPVLGGINAGRKWIVGAGTHGCWLGTYESDKQQIVQKLLKPGHVVFDVGAHAGFYSLAFARLIGESGMVFAFEPLAENVTHLRHHLRLNAVANVKVVQSAVSDRTGWTRFAPAASNFMGKIADDGDYWVPTLSLDNVIESGLAPWPDVIKMDVEGAENLVMRGARRLLAAKRATWLVALHGHEQRDECVQILRANKYRVFLLDGTDPALRQDYAEVYAVPS